MPRDSRALGNLRAAQLGMASSALYYALLGR